MNGNNLNLVAAFGQVIDDDAQLIANASHVPNAAISHVNIPQVRQVP